MIQPLGEVKLFDKMSLAAGTRLRPYEILAPIDVCPHGRGVHAPATESQLIRGALEVEEMPVGKISFPQLQRLNLCSVGAERPVSCVPWS